LCPLSPGLRPPQTGSRVALRDVVSANGASAPAKAFGDPKCPCVGFDNLDGKTLVTFENGAVGSYPSDLGARCEAWDKGRHPECTAGGDDKFCGQKWCFVDSCNCELPVLPKLSGYLPDALYRGRPVFYSYMTCGSEDLFTKHVPETGSTSCRCIGFDNIPGTTNIKLTGADGAEKLVPFPAEVGGTCTAWDKQRHPLCTGGKEQPKWCEQSWCYVDPCSCDLKDPPKVTTYLPGVTFTGKSLYYSYETCGSVDHFTTHYNKDACVNQDNKKECLALKMGGHDKCSWTGEKCLGWELVEHPLCTHIAKSGGMLARPNAFAAALASVLSIRAVVATF